MMVKDVEVPRCKVFCYLRSIDYIIQRKVGIKENIDHRIKVGCMG